MGAHDMQQPMTVTRGYFVRAEQMNDFIDYLFDVEKVDTYSEVWERFEKWQEQKRSAG